MLDLPEVNKFYYFLGLNKKYEPSYFQIVFAKFCFCRLLCQACLLEHELMSSTLVRLSQNPHIKGHSEKPTNHFQKSLNPFPKIFKKIQIFSCNKTG